MPDVKEVIEWVEGKLSEIESKVEEVIEEITDEIKLLLDDDEIDTDGIGEDFDLDDDSDVILVEDESEVEDLSVPEAKPVDGTTAEDGTASPK